MGEGASSKPISFGRYVVFYAVLLYYVAFCSVYTIHFNFVPLFTLRVLHKFWLACLLSLAAFVRYVFFKSNKEYSTEFEDGLVDLPSPSSSMASELPSYSPMSPSSSLLPPLTSLPSSFTSPMSYPHSSFTSPRSSLSSSWSSPRSSPFTSRLSSLSSPWSSPQSSPRSGFSSSPPSSFTSTPSYPHSSFTSPSSSLLSSPCSSPQSSPRSAFSSSSTSLPPPPPPFKMRPLKFKYVRIASNVSFSSEDSGDSDIDTKAEKFIAQFRSQLKVEEERLHERASKA